MKRLTNHFCAWPLPARYPPWMCAFLFISQAVFPSILSTVFMIYFFFLLLVLLLWCLILTLYMPSRLRCIFIPLLLTLSYDIVLNSHSKYVFDAPSLSTFVSHSHISISWTCLCKPMFLSVAFCKIRTFSLKENKIMWVYKSMFAFNLPCLVRQWKNKKFSRYFTIFLLNRQGFLRYATLLAASQTWSFGTDKDHSTFQTVTSKRRSQWPRGLRRGSAAALFLGLWVRILPEE